MKSFLQTVLLLTTVSTITNAQFIEKAAVEYEVKTNVKKTMGSSAWAENMKDKLPTFKTAYYQYTFDSSKSYYQFDRWENKESLPEFFRQSDEKINWACDYNAGTVHKKMDVFGSLFNIQDSLPVIRWKILNENRVIAGYNCKKAVGVIMDSVYVFAFYSDEIMITGGPCSLHGLPGLILGVTIPRLYTSWIATKVNTSNVVFNKPTPDTKNPFTYKKALTTIMDRTKAWMSADDPESRKWLDQLIWNVML
jgi:GLPGLI family protein